MEVIGAVASIVTLIALAKEIANVVGDFSQGYAQAPKELVQLSSHISLITLELECLHRLQHASGMSSCLTNEELKMLAKALNTAKTEMTVLRDECANVLNAKTSLSKRLSWALFDSKTAERALERLQKTEHHLLFILQIINICRAARAQVENSRQVELILDQLREYHNETQNTSLQQDHPHTITTVAQMERSTIFRHKYTMALSDYWRRYISGDLSFTTVRNDFQAAHEFYMQLPMVTLRNRMTLIVSLSFRRSLGYLPNISIISGGLNCFNMVPEDSDIVAACKRGDTLAVRSLFSEKKAAPNDMTVDSRSLIFYAARSGSTDLVRFLINAGAPLQSKQLFVTSFWRNPNATRLLLQNGASLDILGENGHTFTTYLYGKSRPRIPQTEFIDILAGNSFAHFNTQESNGWTVMHRAAAWGTAADIHALHRSEASAELRSYRLGWTPIFLAICYNNMDTLRALWKCSSEETNREQRDFRGWNLLHIAVCYDNFEAVKWLLEKGVSIDTKSEATSSFVPTLLRGISVTPGDLARNCGEEAYIRWVEQVQGSGRNEDVRPEDIDWSQEEVDGFFLLCECCDQWIVQGTNS